MTKHADGKADSYMARRIVGHQNYRLMDVAPSNCKGEEMQVGTYDFDDNRLNLRNSLVMCGGGGKEYAGPYVVGGE